MDSTEICRFLEWDSNFFKRRIARASVDRLDPTSMESIFKWCEELQIDCLYFLADPTDVQTSLLAEKNDFRFVDIRVALEKSLSKDQSTGDIQYPFILRANQPNDLPYLKEIAGRIFQFTRFYFDENFRREDCDLMYQTWIEKSCQSYADTVIVAEQGGQPVGFITCSRESQYEGSLGLVGVDPMDRRMGIGQALMGGALQWFSDQSIEKVKVATQGRNVSGLRLYQRHGFLIKSVQIWYHKWFSIIEHPKSL